MAVDLVMRIKSQGFRMAYLNSQAKKNYKNHGKRTCRADRLKAGYPSQSLRARAQSPVEEQREKVRIGIACTFS